MKTLVPSRPWRGGLLALALVLVAGATQASDELRVLSYMAPSVGLQDESGKLVGTIDAKELPSTPVPVKQINKRGAVMVEGKDGASLWLDPMDVELSHQGNIEQLCLSLAKGRSPDRKVAGSMGMGPGCGAK